MSRKNPSTHSDAQFALFVDLMKNMRNGGATSEFDQAVRRLIAAGRKDSPGTGWEEAGDDREADDRCTAETLPPSSRPSALDDLPDPPDFEAIEAAAHETDAGRAKLLSLIGELVLSSSNNESLLIYILMVLLQTDEPSAALVFAALSGTRARLDLISRLARSKIDDDETRRALDQVVSDFNDAQRTRNEVLHAADTVNGPGAITQTQTMRLIRKGRRTSFGEQTPIDQERLDGMVKACQDLKILNRKIWDLLPRLQDAVAKA